MNLYPDLMNRRPLFGLDIIEAPVRRVPVLELRAEIPVTDEFREEMNAWLVEMFGTREFCPVPPGMMLMFGNSVVMRPESVVAISNAAC